MAVDADTAERSLAASLEETTRSAEERQEEETVADADAIDVDHPENSDTHLAQSRKTLRLALAAVLVTLAALIGVGVWTGHQIAQEHQADEHQEMLVGVARQAALNLTTIDHTSVDSDIKRILDSSTGTFHDDFQKRADPFVQAVTEAQSTSVGTVTEAGMESQEGDDTKVLVAVAVKTSSAGVEEPQPRAWRMRITVTQPSGQDPKVSNVQFVP